MAVVRVFQACSLLFTIRLDRFLDVGCGPACSPSLFLCCLGMLRGIEKIILG